MSMWEHAAALAWVELAKTGEVRTYKCLSFGGIALGWAARLVPRIRDDYRLVINTNDGDSSVWNVADALEENVWPCYVETCALSAGLILACACRGRRSCHPDARFLYHGLDHRNPEEEDLRRSEWLAARTTQPVEFWLEWSRSETALEFGAEEALAWGVVHEIAPHVLQVEWRCPECGAVVARDAKFCWQCQSGSPIEKGASDDSRT